MLFFPSSGHVDTAKWMHYMDANKTYGEKFWQQLHKNAASNIEQVQEPTPHKAAVPPITKTIKFRRTRHARHCWRSGDELISDIPLWTPSHGRAKTRRPSRTFVQHVCTDTGCSFEDLSERWTIETGSERGSGRSKLAAWHHDDILGAQYVDYF